MDDVWIAFSGGLPQGSTPVTERGALQQCIQAAADAWPDLDVPMVDVAAALARLVGVTAQMPTRKVAEELYLALACERGLTTAIEYFEKRYFRGLELDGIVGTHSDVDDVRQRLRTRLFVAPTGARARVVDAVGHGDLGALVRIAATRLALNARRGERRRRDRAQTFTADATLLQPAADTPELEVLRRTHAARFKEAFEAAVAQLSARDRTLLRYHLVEHLTIDDLATMHGVHRSSAARWLASARVLVAEHTQERLADLVDDKEALPSLFALVRSQLDLSITRVFAARDEAVE